MEALIPKLFIITAEASLVLFLILIIMIIFNMKAKRKDINAVNELVSNYTGNKDERIASLKKQLNQIAFKGDTDAQAAKLFDSEKAVVKEFVTLYLRHEIYRLLDYPENLIDNHTLFLKTSGSGQAATVTEVPVIETVVSEETRSQETANATIQAREQAESNEAHLKELSELRLKNTELNEHLFEALETITTLMTEHGKKTGQEVESNAQKVLEAIIYLRDKRLEHDKDPAKLAPSADDGHDQVDNFNLDASNDMDLESNDATLDDSPSVNLGINDELNMDLDTLEEDETSIDTPNESALNLDDTASEPKTAEEDPWADALAEQASSEAEVDSPAESAEPEEDPWADALAEQANSEEANSPAESAEPEEDPWADALAEQATSEAEANSPAETEEPEVDPWADALAEQATAEAEEVDPWADALAEQEKSENK